MKYLYWALLWIPLFLVGIIGRFLSPIAVIFIERAPRLDTVKRLGKKEVAVATFGLGSASSQMGAEIYTQIEIFKDA